MIDSHCHLDFPALLPDLPAVLAAAHKAGVHAFVVPAIGKQNWQVLHGLSEHYQDIHVAYGIHPWFLDTVGEDDLQALKTWVATHDCVAVGECGLDFYHGRDTQTLQTRIFVFQLALAKQQQLPVIIHSRKAVAQVLHLCKQQQVSQGVLHGFAGSLQQAQQAISMGFYLGVGGLICNPRAHKIRAMVAQLPLSHILLETDSPDQSVAESAEGEKKAGTPADILLIAKALAALQDVPFETVLVQCAANAKACFRL